MTDENVETVRKVVAAFNRRDFDAALAPLRDDVTWERFLSRAEAAGPAVRGKAELLAVWKSQVEAVDLRVEPEEFIPLGDKVIAPMRMVVHGSGSEIELTSSVTWVSTFDDGGLCTKVEAYENRDDALRAARSE
jgi:ketosteroid isomerase-like protein